MSNIEERVHQSEIRTAGTHNAIEAMGGRSDETFREIQGQMQHFIKQIDSGYRHVNNGLESKINGLAAAIQGTEDKYTRESAKIAKQLAKLTEALLPRIKDREGETVSEIASSAGDTEMGGEKQIDVAHWALARDQTQQTQRRKEPQGY